MGKRQVSLTATSTVSNHNSAQDDADWIEWDRFVQIVKLVADGMELDVYVNASIREDW